MDSGGDDRVFRVRLCAAVQAAEIAQRVPLTLDHEAADSLIASFRGEADEDQRPSERPLIAISGHLPHKEIGSFPYVR